MSFTIYVHKSVFAALIELDFYARPPLLIIYPKEKMHSHKMYGSPKYAHSECCKTVAVQYYRSTLYLSFSDYCMNVLSCFEFYIGQMG